MSIRVAFSRVLPGITLCVVAAISQGCVARGHDADATAAELQSARATALLQQQRLTALENRVRELEFQAKALVASTTAAAPASSGAETEAAFPAEPSPPAEQTHPPGNPRFQCESEDMRGYSLDWGRLGPRPARDARTGHARSLDQGDPWAHD